MLLEWIPRLSLGYELYGLCFLYTFIIAMYVVMNYPLRMPNLVAFYAKLNEMGKIEFHFALEVSFGII